MSQPNTSAGSSGVVPNSALSFVADQPAAAPAHIVDMPHNSGQEGQETLVPGDRTVPAGLKALCEAYSRLYPDQPNPLQVTTRLKYWLGGHDPLDYISMYWNPGKPEENIPPHWHYVSFGLSDLHGDGRVHAWGPPGPSGPSGLSGPSGPSGAGAELTLRLAADAGAPPLWPAALLQALARYVFTTGNKFCAGDHISWHAPLDGSPQPRSRIRHLLVAEDPQLDTIHTPHGTVAFLQMVGCTGRELRAAQRGSGFEVLKQISEDPKCGAGAWLVTRVSRRASAAPAPAPAAAPAPAPAPAPTATLAGVSTRLRWHGVPAAAQAGSAARDGSPLPAHVQQLIKDTLQRGLRSMGGDHAPEGHMSTDSFEMSSMERALPHIPELMQGSWQNEESIEYFESVHLILNAEGASLLPLAIDGRIRHGRHFTWRGGGGGAGCGAGGGAGCGAGGAGAATLLPRAVAGAAAAPHAPYAARGRWLQILIPKPLAEDMSRKVARFSSLADTDSESDGDQGERDREPITLPLTLSWPDYKLEITVVPDGELL